MKTATNERIGLTSMQKGKFRTRKLDAGTAVETAIAKAVDSAKSSQDEATLSIGEFGFIIFPSDSMADGLSRWQRLYGA